MVPKTESARPKGQDKVSNAIAGWGATAAITVTAVSFVQTPVDGVFEMLPQVFVWQAVLNVDFTSHFLELILSLHVPVFRHVLTQLSPWLVHGLWGPDIKGVSSLPHLRFHRLRAVPAILLLPAHFAVHHDAWACNFQARVDR